MPAKCLPVEKRNREEVPIEAPEFPNSPKNGQDTSDTDGSLPQRKEKKTRTKINRFDCWSCNYKPKSKADKSRIFDDTYCRRCGICRGCPQCKAPLTSEDNFCGSCGFKREEKKSTAAAE